MIADAVEETVATGTYWDPDTWQDARAAYVADLDNDPNGPDAFVGWLHRAIQDHVARGPAGRGQLQISIPRRAGGRGLNRHHPLQASTRAALEDAVVADRLAGRVVSRSIFVHEAITAAVDQARTRAGGSLTPVVGRLPNRPPRRSA